MNLLADDYGLFKRYVVLYTCAFTRGVVLELVPDASSKNFAYSFRKFIAHRGCPGELLKNNGTVFTSQETQKFASNQNISWEFSLTNAPWYGGFWERLISVVKRCLKKAIHKACLNFYELQIVLSEIELTLNSKPLNQLCDDDTSNIMTPNHLLFERKLYQINPNFEHSYEEFEIDMPKRVKHVENTIEHFWKRWQAEYITSLREYQKLHKLKTQAVPSKNDLVLVLDDKQPRQKWLLGKITKLIPSNDGKI